jgi:hypothetical protein
MATSKPKFCKGTIWENRRTKNPADTDITLIIIALPLCNIVSFYGFFSIPVIYQMLIETGNYMDGIIDADTQGNAATSTVAISRGIPVIPMNPNNTMIVATTGMRQKFLLKRSAISALQLIQP